MGQKRSSAYDSMLRFLAKWGRPNATPRIWNLRLPLKTTRLSGPRSVMVIQIDSPRAVLERWWAPSRASPSCYGIMVVAPTRLTTYILEAWRSLQRDSLYLFLRLGGRSSATRYSLICTNLVVAQTRLTSRLFKEFGGRSNMTHQ